MIVPGSAGGTAGSGRTNAVGVGAGASASIGGGTGIGSGAGSGPDTGGGDGVPEVGMPQASKYVILRNLRMPDE